MATVPARAEVGVTVSAASDDRFRGESISDKRPVASAQLSYDDASGFYAGVSGGLVVTRYDGLQPSQSVQYLGYAHPLRPDLSIDIGLTNHVYGKYFSGEYARRFAEAYVGLVGRRLSGHLFFAPDYNGHGGSAVYGEASALLLDSAQWSISGHAGLLAPPKEPGWEHSRAPVLDWRLGATRRLGRLGVSLNWVGATHNYRSSSVRSALVLSASRSF